MGGPHLDVLHLAFVVGAARPDHGDDVEDAGDEPLPIGVLEDADAASGEFGPEDYASEDYDEALEGEDELAPELGAAPVIPLVELLV